MAPAGTERDVGRFQFNTVAMASLAVIFVVFSVSLLSGIVYDQHLDEFGYPVEVVDAGPGDGGEDDGPAFDPVLPLLASADPAAGEGIFRKCASCHSTGEENKVGPGLGGVVNRPIAGHAGFGYSSAMIDHAAEAPAWTYSELNAFLWKPKDVGARHLDGLRRPVGRRGPGERDRLSAADLRRSRAADRGGDRGPSWRPRRRS